MPGLNVPSYHGDPTSTASISNAYVAVIDFHLSSLRQTIGFTLGYYRSKADFAANVNPVNTASYNITPNEEKRADDAIIPSYAQVVGSAVTHETDSVGTLAFVIVERAIYEFLLRLPEFEGATVIS
jgi:tRNA A-37 threonylcarbamoyl transferase component Bud32